uniref:FCP1 homology domain-containing protein n=1 Tax=Globodera pallida TaxID=36090 RepID=A0A183CJ90_GLOPA
YKKGHYFVKRPALEYFMDVVGYPNFELVIYTSETMMQAWDLAGSPGSRRFKWPKFVLRFGAMVQNWGNTNPSSDFANVEPQTRIRTFFEISCT